MYQIIRDKVMNPLCIIQYKIDCLKEWLITVNDDGLEDDFEAEADQVSIDPIGEAGAGLLAYSLFNLAIGPHNAYNQIPKSSDWFKTALT